MLDFSCFRPGTDFKDVTIGSHSLKFSVSSIRYKDFEGNLLPKKTVINGLLQKMQVDILEGVVTSLIEKEELVDYYNGIGIIFIFNILFGV